MRLPYLQVDSEAFERAVEIAALLDISEAQALGHLAFLWRWCLSRPQDEALSGLVGGTDPIRVLEAGARWRGKQGALVGVLLELGLVHPADDTGNLRVCGLDRYREAISRRTSDRERKAKTRMSGGRPRDGVRNPASDADADADADADLKNVRTSQERPLSLQRLEAPDTPPEGWTADDFWRWYQWTRVDGVDGLPQEKPLHPRKLSSWWAEARGQCTVAQLQAAAHRYGSDPFWRRQVPPVPFAGFASQWARFIAEEVHDVG